jgi:hypothetical protein
MEFTHRTYACSNVIYRGTCHSAGRNLHRWHRRGAAILANRGAAAKRPLFAFDRDPYAVATATVSACPLPLSTLLDRLSQHPQEMDGGLSALDGIC